MHTTGSKILNKLTLSTNSVSVSARRSYFARERTEGFLGQGRRSSFRKGISRGALVGMDEFEGAEFDERGGRGGKGGRRWDDRNRGGRSGGGGRGGQGGGRGGRSGGKGEPREVLISKALSRLLRHAAVEEGVVLDGEGFAGVEDVLKYSRLRSLQATFTDIHSAVLNSPKQRFSLKPNPIIDPPPSPTSTTPSDWLIRANQGHSIALDSAAHLTPITLAADNIPETVVHGTYFAFWEAIVQSGGLRKMGRNHVHFGTGVPGEDGEEVVSGMRGDAEVLVYVDVKGSLEDGEVLVKEGKEGLKWWLSENGVVLTEGDVKGVVPLRFFQRVVGRRVDVGVLVQDGLEVGKLPENLRGRKAPPGKGWAGRGGRGANRGRGGCGKQRGKVLADTSNEGDGSGSVES